MITKPLMTPLARAKPKEFPLLRRTITMLCASAALATVSACAPAGGDQAPTSDNASPTSSVSDPSLTIDKPKNLAGVDPCKLLSPEQLTMLGNEGEPRPADTLFGTKDCSWSGDKFAVAITPVTTLHRDAKRMYLDAKKAGNPEKYQIDGYPAATLAKEPVIGTIEVMVAEHQSFNVQYTKHSGGTPEMDDPVGYAKKIAAEVLKNIPDA